MVVIVFEMVTVMIMMILANAMVACFWFGCYAAHDFQSLVISNKFSSRRSLHALRPVSTSASR